MDATPAHLDVVWSPRRGSEALTRVASGLGIDPYPAKIVESVTLATASMVALSGEALLVAAAAVLLRALRTPIPRLTVRPLDDVVRGAIDLFAVFGVAVVVLGPAVLDQTGAWGLVVAAALVARVVTESLRWVARRTTAAARPDVLVVGTAEPLEELTRTLRQHPGYGVDASEVVLPADATPTDASETLRHKVRHLGADAVVVAEDGLPAATVQVLLRDRPEVPLFVAASHSGTVGFGGGVETLWGTRVLAAPVPPMQRPSWLFRSTVERMVAAVALVTLAPFLGLLALGVRLSSPGPILFRQERIGLGGQPFTILKFRSMPVDHEVTGWNAAHHARTTRFGRVLRDLSLDELPQLYNVVRGEMSLVGPRPEQPGYVELFNETVPGYRERHRVPVGLTGWAQVHGLRGSTSIVDRARFDNNYIDDWSVGRDLVVLVGTVAQLLPERLRPAPAPLGDDVMIDLSDTRDDPAPERPATARAS